MNSDMTKTRYDKAERILLAIDRDSDKILVPWFQFIVKYVQRKQKEIPLQKICEKNFGMGSGKQKRPGLT